MNHLLFIWNKCNINFFTSFHVFNYICLLERLKYVIRYGCIRIDYFHSFQINKKREKKLIKLLNAKEINW